MKWNLKKQNKIDLLYFIGEGSSKLIEAFSESCNGD